MAYEAVDCVDAGSDYCPCYLAETNNCIICSQLQGKVFCDCINWKGVCIYQEYVWNGNQRKEIRENTTGQIVKSEMLNNKVLFMTVKVSRTLARELNQPGSYIFIRDENYPEFFDVPMSIMYSNEIDETVDLLIQIRGVKTKILKDLNKSISIRGPYWNGIMGLKNLKIVKNKSCLVVARGCSQAPAVLVAKKLRYANNNVIVILDGGNVETTYSKKYFVDLGCEVIETKILNGRVFDENAGLMIKNIIKDRDIDLVFSGGSDIIHRKLINITKSFSKNILFASTNNATICCGEGVCGSCITRLRDGRKIKACKAQVDPIDMVGGGI